MYTMNDSVEEQRILRNRGTKYVQKSLNVTMQLNNVVKDTYVLRTFIGWAIEHKSRKVMLPDCK